mmetsp:Transcript_60237/g.143576  ORF Transcript_60237/g.143576 Transcript_60237/m.143576 type:complete len:313 (-) Transcript_60237:90-1028(-)
METFRLNKHRLGDAFRNTVSAVIGTSSESKFVQSGTLTPEEFTDAGNMLTFKFPTWQWVSCDPSRRHSCLDNEKQYLITRNVPCKDRVRALDHVLAHNTRVEDEWLVPETEATAGAPDTQEIRDLDPGNDGDADVSGIGGFVVQEDFIGTAQASDADLPDFTDLDAALAEKDPGSAAPAQADYVVANAPDMEIVRTRTYDLSITYDKYYQTPRLWLFGYDEYGEPLKPEQVYEDVLSDYISKTVTFDPHPHTGTPTVSIHPCKHARVMKKVVDDWIEEGREPRHDLALFVFLKFISSVVPTINYDFTMDIEF